MIDCQISVGWLAWEAPNDAVIEVGVVESRGVSWCSKAGGV